MSEKLKLISVKTLIDEDYTFIIPPYQRGFRWTKRQVKELIDDLYEFSKDHQRQKYCLQSIVVQNTGKENEFYVIDGQQRLTAIWLLIMSNIAETRDFLQKPYTLRYDGKKSFSEYTRKIRENVLPYSGIETLICNDFCDIDSKYLTNALEFIKSYKTQKGVPIGQVLNRIFDDCYIDGTKQICFIWNEISDGDTDTAIEKFSNINANKIPLTESELIKAYLINGVKENRHSSEISYQWEAMERKLSEESFWAFVSGEEEETRMDLLFRVWLRKRGKTEKSADRHFLSREVYEELKGNNAKNIDPAMNVWKDVVQIFSVLCDWYEDYYYYHMIGLQIALNAAESISPAETICELYEKYSEKSKNDFIEFLKECVQTCSSFNLPFSITGKKEQRSWNVRSEKEIILDDDKLAYDQDKGAVKAILLLFNIALLLNAYEVNRLNASERFPFEIYKDKKINPIEIEHINPKHLEGTNASGKEYSGEDKKNWALETLKIIPEKEREDLKIKINNANWNDKQENLISRIEEMAELNRLSNLTLVDKQLNISYGDKFFLDKRRHLLAARFGLSADGIAERKHSVIFPGTMWVFMRQYLDASQAEMSEEEKKNLAENRWTAKDREEYIQMMQESIYRLLKDKSETTEKEGETDA